MKLFLSIFLFLRLLVPDSSGVLQPIMESTGAEENVTACVTITNVCLPPSINSGVEGKWYVYARYKFHNADTTMSQLCPVDSDSSKSTCVVKVSAMLFTVELRLYCSVQDIGHTK